MAFPLLAGATPPVPQTPEKKAASSCIGHGSTGAIQSEMTTMSALFMMKESDLVVYFKDRSNNGDGN
jgi:hypothetical protein